MGTKLTRFYHWNECNLSNFVVHCKLGIQKLGLILDCKVPLNQKLAKMSQLKLILSIENHFSGSIYWNLRVKVDPEML